MRPSLALAVLAAACATPPTGPGTPSVPATAPPSLTATPADARRGPAHVRDARLNEISGVAESHKNPDVLFVHNDSGDSPRFFAINRQGEVLAELVLSTVPLLIDAEDIAIGPGPGGGSYVYLGDTGNNFASFGQGIPRRKAVIYRVPEPDVPSSARQLRVPLSEAFPIVFTFPQGARDIEAFFVDPVTGELFLITKQPDGHSQLLMASVAQLVGGGGKLALVAELHFGRGSLPGSTMPTSAAISKDGAAILVRTYSSVLLFTRAAGESVPSALSRVPRVLPSPDEPQGEAIAFVDRDRAFLTISEGVAPVINWIPIAGDRAP